MRTLLLAAVLIPAVAGSARAEILTFTNFEAFRAAVGGGPLTIEGYEGLAPNTLIPGGTVLNGVAYNFSPPTLGGSQGQGRIDDQLVAFGQSLAIFRTTTSPAFGQEPPLESFFYPGESVTVTFPNPVNAVGVFFNAEPSATGPGEMFVSTALGTAFNGGDNTAVFGSPNEITPTLYFVGLISTTGTFTSATIGSIDTGVNGGFNLDNLSFGVAQVAEIPEPATLAVFAGLLTAGGLARRRRGA
jgi:hypothetical protein